MEELYGVNFSEASSLEEIEEGAFEGCALRSELDIPSTVKVVPGVYVYKSGMTFGISSESK